MATFGTQVRRGLPRRPGGEPWPPAREDAEDQVPAASVVERAERDETLAAGIVIAQSPVAGSDAADARVATAEAPVAPQSPVAGSDAADARPVAREPVGSAGAGSAHTLRRGLPRTPGGEPWPPADAVAAHSALSAAAPVADAAPSAERMKRDETPAGAAIAAAGAAVGDRVDRGESPAAATPATSTDVSLQDAAVAPTATGGVALRRGLPRVAGGEPWPPAGVVPDRTAAAAAAAVAGPAPAAVAAGPAPAPEVAPAAAAAATPEPSPTDLAETPPIPAAAGAVPTAAAVDLSVPLPFTRTVFPGANAFTHVPPAAEPERIGPFTRLQWAGAAIVGGGGLLFAAGMAVLLVRWLLSLEFMQDFLTAYPGEYELPAGAPVGIPPWLGWQHFFNVFLIVLIIRSGLQVRTEKRPTAFWSPRSNGKRKISLNLWLHQSLDILWIVNGVIYVVLLLATGQWMKIVPTSWEVFPNAVSAALQYVSLDWPTENGWVNYNSLQQLAYFATVFLAAPLAIATGVRMSGIWPSSAKTLSRIYPVEWARAIHFPVMLYFVAFILVHVALVLATSALRNLNHMYASQDVVNWTGFWIFAASLVVIAAGWVAARPLVLAPVARLFGNVSGR